MAAVIKLKRSSTAGVVPTTSDIEAGELALNVKDEKLYSSNGTGVFQVFTGCLLYTSPSPRDDT